MIIVLVWDRGLDRFLIEQLPCRGKKMIYCRCRRAVESTVVVAVSLDRRA